MRIFDDPGTRRSYLMVLVKALFGLLLVTMFAADVAWSQQRPVNPAQQPGPPPPPSPPMGDQPEIPIDGGLGILLLAGGAYAAHKMRTKAGSEV
jgi:hypothetical protein